MTGKRVSDSWEEFLSRGGVYFPKDVDRGFFSDILSSRWVVSLLKDGSRKKFLSAGCGLGRFAIAIAAAGRDVALMDCSEESLNAARLLGEIAKRHFGDISIRFLKDDLERTSFADGEFDVTFNEGVVEHWLDRGERIKVIKEMARITRDGGVVSIRVINNKNPLYNLIYKKALREDVPAHHRYDMRELKAEMEDAGLDPVLWDGETINDPDEYSANKLLIKTLRIAALAINTAPKFVREAFCPSIFCTAIVRRTRP
ncbi:MAG: class I SAM-dependent methyltransferase [Candidatus Omnitrophota bacterium]|nr:class I SAM-dependent methyltransferase [Candidatus Omnitrophota bacterium]